MRNFFVLLLAACVLLPLGSRAQKVRTVNGVTVVSNGKKPTPPKGESATLQLVEEMTFGLGDNPDQAISEVNAFVVDDAGTVYALDVRDRKVKVFDRDGKFLRQIGKPGQGPGELGLPANILLTSDNLLVIADAANQKLSFFKVSGEHVRDLSTAGRLGFVVLAMDARGNFLGQEMSIDTGSMKMFYEIRKFSPDFKPMFTLDRIEFPIPVPGSGTKINALELASVYEFDAEGNLLFGRSGAYSIKVFDPEGKHVRTIEKEFTPEKVTQGDIDEMMERMEAFSMGQNLKDLIAFPEKFPPFQNIFLDDRGRLFVRTFAKGKARGEWVIDVFDQQGVFVAQLVTKSDLRLIKRGKAYGIEESDEGFRVIKRYALT